MQNRLISVGFQFENCAAAETVVQGTAVSGRASTEFCHAVKISTGIEHQRPAGKCAVVWSALKAVEDGHVSTRIHLENGAAAVSTTRGAPSRSSRAVEVAFGVANQATERFSAIRSTLEGVQYLLHSVRPYLEDRSTSLGE